jgi:signal transduction histidine kinase/HPt (histidine-containing phosphotransfer) domain-containing protein
MVALVLIVASGTLLVVAVMNYIAARATLSTVESHLRDNIRRKGNDLVSSQALALRDLVADNAFGDVARLIERTVEGDEDIAYGLFLGDDGKAWGFASRLTTPSGGRAQAWGDLGVASDSLPDAGGQTGTHQVLGETVFAFGRRVVDDKDAYLGTLRYALSHRPLERALGDARTASRRALTTTIALLLLLGSGATILGSVFSRRAASRITRPLGELTVAANALAQGRRDIRVSIDSGDELEQLGTAFNNMVNEIREYTIRLEEVNRGLETKVQERTQALSGRNRDMRLVLDNVDQGLVTISPEGVLTQERSAIVDRWFGAYAPETRFTDYMSRIDPLYAETFALAYEALWEDVLPRALCLEQLPRRLRHGDEHFQCTYFPLGQGGLEGMLVVIDDITDQLRAAGQEAERKEMLALFEACAKDRIGFLAFVDETNDLLTRVRTADLATQKRLVHTIKGNASLVGLGAVASLCHQLEDVLAERHLSLNATDLAPLEQRWAQLTKALDGFVGDGSRDVVIIPVDELERMAQEIGLGVQVSRLADRLTSWRLEPAERALTRLGNHARALAARFGKGPLNVVIDGGGVRLPPHTWTPVWSELIHVVRNAVDHGVDSRAERLKTGKTSPATLRLSTRQVDGQIVIEIEDDGAGIDWAGIKRAAFRRGLPHETEDELVRAMFTADVTTRSEVTTISGRGVGLAAVLAQVEAAGGTAAVRSRLGEGTCFTFTFPIPELGTGRGPDARSKVSGGRSAVA